ncbi:hypothetical protein PALB_5260 [Pseudoalteromonas luteoviolacea B = ATCC 29581]|nr:hypothetical protein PALB_5260 [Pseudoalteromonas luteoviolacea B = ATCC 29581]
MSHLFKARYYTTIAGKTKPKNKKAPLEVLFLQFSSID